jgi:MazG family protein
MKTIQDLLEIMARLRDPQKGCPWDREQDFASIAPYTIEEAYEVADAIDRGDTGALRDELGDLLFQVVYHAQMAREAGSFEFDDVVEAICDKMVRRHPHVFGGADVGDAQAQTRAWEAHKQAERRDRAEHGVLEGVPLAIPALARAAKLGKRASRVGFDWPDVTGVVAKIREEIDELERELDGMDPVRLGDEVGDLLFAAVNLARHLRVDPEEALRRANRRFEQRFNYVESSVSANGESIEKVGTDALEALWIKAKSSGL